MRGCMSAEGRGWGVFEGACLLEQRVASVRECLSAEA